MTTKRKFTVGIALAAVALIGIAVIEISRGARSLIAGFDRGMQSRYEKIAGENGVSVQILTESDRLALGAASLRLVAHAVGGRVDG